MIEAPLPPFRFEDASGQVITEQTLAAVSGRSDEWKRREAARYRDLWDGYRPGRVIIEDDTPRGFHWADDGQDRAAP